MSSEEPAVSEVRQPGHLLHVRDVDDAPGVEGLLRLVPVARDGRGVRVVISDWSHEQWMAYGKRNKQQYGRVMREQGALVAEIERGIDILRMNECYVPRCRIDRLFREKGKLEWWRLYLPGGRYNDAYGYGREHPESPALKMGLAALCMEAFR